MFEAEITNSSHCGQWFSPRVWFGTYGKVYGVNVNQPYFRQGIGIGLHKRRYIGIFLAGSAGLKT